jgi:3-oxoacyl-[acyl-carrier protein] reductase
MNILVTGGASGLGKSITLAFLQKKENKVYFTYSSSNESARIIEKEFSNAAAFCCNFKDETTVEKFIGQIDDMELDVLVNNAYVGEPIQSYFHRTNFKVFDEDFKFNVLPTIKITQKVLEGFKKRKSGKIITVLTSFLHGKRPLGSSSYTSMKAYLLELSKGWSHEYIKYGITSNTISPSFMLTSLNKMVDERIIESLKDSNPLGQLLSPKEVAEIIVSCCSYSKHFNSVDLIIDSSTI